jgi:lipopolysaccharide transport system permease protein
MKTPHADDTVTTYEPDNSLKRGYPALCAEIFRELANNRWLIFQLLKREFSVKYKQSFSGVVWAVVMPLSTLATFMLLHSSGIFNVGRVNVPYPVYAVFSMALWQLFATGLICSANALVDAGSMIIKINFSKKSLVIASFGQSLLSFAIYLVLSTLLFAWYRFVPSASLLLIPLVIVPLLLLTLGLGFILALLNGVTRDVGNVLSLATTFLMFLTPVLYAKPATGILATITRYNPLYYLIAVPKDLMFLGSTTEWQGFCASALLSLMVFSVCLLVFHLTETRVAERI